MVGAAVTYRANVDVNGAQSTGSVFGAAITTTPAVNRVNGPTVYVALATNGSLDPAHDPDAPPGIFDVYLRRSQPLSILAISPSSTTLISRATGASTNAANGGDPSISADGTKVAFTTTSNLDAADTGNDRDVYLRDVNANTTTLVSRPDGVVGQADGSSFASEISNDGGSVVFDSNASNMDDDSGPDVNGVPGRDIYIRRLAANETVTASLVSGSLTQRGTGESLNASISSDGNRVAFLTTSANLGDGDTDTTADIHVRDLTTNVTTWASRADGPGGGPTGEGGRDAAISGDGAGVLFDGPARAVAPGSGGDAGQVFLRTLAAGTTRLVSRPTGPDTGAFAQLVSRSSLTPADFDDGDSQPLARRVTSADGRFVVFASESDGMLPGLGSPARQIFVRDMVAGTTRLVSHDASGAPGTDDSGQPTISADGSVVAFTTRAPNLGAVTNAQVNVWRAATDSVSIASATPAGAAGNGRSYSASLSTDGTKLAFESLATDLGETPAPGVTVNAWWRDLTTGTTRLASRADGAAGAAANGASFRPAISGDGKRVGFATVATNLGNGDASATVDVHVRDIAAGTTQWASRVNGPGGVGANGNSVYPSLDADGGVVAFESVATNLTDDDTDAVPDIFTRDLGSGRTTLISRASGAAGDKGTKSSIVPLISGDGRRVAFESLAPNLVPDDPNTADDVFVRDLAARTTVGVSRVDGAGGTLLGLDDRAAFGASPDLHCVAFESDRPAFVAGGYSSPDFTQIYLRTVSGDCAANPAVPGAGAGGAGKVKLTRVSLRPKAFRPRANGRGGAILRFTLSEKARVKVTVQRPLVGHRRAKRCAVRFRTGKRCTVWKAVGSLTIAGKAGANRRVFTAKLKRRTLAPGRYRLFLVVVKAGKRASTPRTVRFRIKPPPAR